MGWFPFVVHHIVVTPFLWFCEPSTNGFCKSSPIFCPLFCGCILPIKWAWWTWVDSHLSSSIVYGHGLIPICHPPSGEHGFIPIFHSPFGVVGELNGHGLIPICCPPSGEHGLIPICRSPSGPNWLCLVDMSWFPFVVPFLCMDMGYCPLVAHVCVRTWVNAHLLSLFVYGHGLMPICCPFLFCVRTWVNAHLLSVFRWT